MEKAKAEAVPAPKDPATVLELLEEDDEFEVFSKYSICNLKP